MSILPQDLLVGAKAIQSMDGEALQRSAISRAYYSVYHACLAWEKLLPAVGSENGPAGGKHQMLINRLGSVHMFLKNDEQKTLSKKVAYKLKAMRDQRVISDYRLQENLPFKTYAANECAEAERILAALFPENSTKDDEPQSLTSDANKSCDIEAVKGAQEVEAPKPAPRRPTLKLLK